MARSTSSRRSSLTAPPPCSGPVGPTGSSTPGWHSTRQSANLRPVYVVHAGAPLGGASHTRTGTPVPTLPKVTRYGSDVLSGDWRRRGRPAAAEVPAEPGLVVEDADTGWCGAVSRVEKAGGMRVVHL